MLYYTVVCMKGGLFMDKVIKIAKIFFFMLVKRIILLFTTVLRKNDSDTYYKIVRSWAQYTIRIIKAQVETVGQDNLPEGNCLFVSNHQSNVDIPLILSQIDKPMGFIAKKQLEHVPLMSFWMKKIHCVFLNRDSVRDAVESINEGARILQNSSSMVIFPEGTRSRQDTMGDFKKGSIKLGLKASVPIVPLTICGSYKSYEQNNKFTPSSIKLVIGKPIYIENLSKEEKKNLTEIIKESIQNNYDLSH